MSNYPLLELELEKIGAETVEYLKKVLIEGDKVATGRLLRSLDYKVVKDMDGLMLRILALDYFKDVDEGRPAGKEPPPDKRKIKSWIVAKKLPYKNLDSTAFFVIRKIQDKGIEPFKVSGMRMKQAVIENVIKKKMMFIKRAAAEDIQVTIDKIFGYKSK